MIGMVQDTVGINNFDNASEGSEDLREILKLLEEVNVVSRLY
jgi:hypothetical protein